MTGRILPHESARVESWSPPLEANRRTFLKWSGVAGLTAIAAGCVEEQKALPTEPAFGASAGRGLGPGQVVNLGRGDVAVLNYAYALEQLEAAFYTLVVANAFGAITDPVERAVLRDLRAHEVTHREFFEATLGKDAIPDLVFDFGAVDFNNRLSVLQTARTFEDLGVAAYNGAAQFLENTTFLIAAAKIVSVEARHASAIRHLLAHDGMAFAPQAFDAALLPAEVLQAADQFIVTKIIDNNLPGGSRGRI